ncbi:hypothetical protein B194_4085 [Serratia plymuthica A30]|nr:hypothetical protein B194_4085 [Serratia plymuthica A30]
MASIIGIFKKLHIKCIFMFAQILAISAGAVNTLIFVAALLSVDLAHRT